KALALSSNGEEPDSFFWPYMRRDMHTFSEQCIIYMREKSKMMPRGLYIHFSIHKSPYVYISIDFILGFLRTNNCKDLVCLSWKAFKYSTFHTLHKVTWRICSLKALYGIKCLPHVEYDYNLATQSTTNKDFAFYGFNSLTPLDLLPTPNISLFMYGPI
ncbi:hypothetical protein Lal_00000756, partial [Lupinus albus]